MIGLVSWFIGLQLRAAPGFVGFYLIVMPRLYSWFYMAYSSQFREALLLHAC